jgi:opacity protein-like surface antigen
MKRYVIVLAAVLALAAIPVIGSAAPFKPGPYFTGFLGVNSLQNTNVTTTNFTANTSANDRLEFDPGFNIGGIGGYDFGFFRLEGEMSYKHGDVSSVTKSGTTFVNTDGGLGAFAVLANGFFNLRNDTPVTPYFGGGLGFARVHLSDISGFQRGAAGGRAILYTADDDTVFAYQLGAGMEIALNRRLSLDLGYRYFATDVARFDVGGAQETSLKFQSHNGTVGLKIKF